MSYRRAYESSLRLRLKREHSQRVPAMQLMILLVFLVGGALQFLHHPLDMLAFWEGNPSMITVMVRAFSYALQLLLKTVLNSVPVVIALLAIQALTSGFVRDLYDTDGREEAEEVFHRHMFGMPGEELRPIMIVKEGRIFVGGGGTYDRIGGPGLLIVYNDSAVVLEKGGRLTRIVSANISFLERFERIWEIVDLRHQRWPFTVSAVTKDGIPVSCEADVTFKIDDRYMDEDGNIRIKLPVKTEAPTITDEAIAAELAKAGITKPIPYTEEAVFNAATSIWVRIHQEKHDEQLRKWTGRVIIGEVEGALRNILARYRLDWLMRPHPAEGPHPREQIRRQLEEKLTKALPMGNGLGARVLQVELGEIKVKDEIAQQWVEAWQAGWEQKALETRAEGEAMLARMDADQIYAQAEMVLLLIDSIRPFVTDVEDFPPYLLAMRFVQTLRWMAYDPLKRVFLSPEIFRTLDQLEAVVGGTDTSAGEPISETERMVREGRRI